MKQLVYTIFITNNHAPFHLWPKKNFVKYKEVSKYFGHCSSRRDDWPILLPNRFTDNQENKKTIINKVTVLGFLSDENLS